MTNIRNRAWLAQRTNNRLEDVLWMVGNGADLTEATRRLGVTEEALALWCRRNGRMAELETLRDRQRLTPAAAKARDAAMARWAS